jgi:hypothetical protein
MTIGSVFSFSRPRHQGHMEDHVYKDMWQTTSIYHDNKRHVADHVNKPQQQKTCGRPRQQTMTAKDMSQTTSADHDIKIHVVYHVSRPRQ